MKHLATVFIIVGLIAGPAVAGGEERPEPAEIVDRMLAAAGGEEFSEIGVLKLEVSDEETRNDGSRTSHEFILYVDTTNLQNIRMEIKGGSVVGCSANGCCCRRGGATPTRSSASIARPVGRCGTRCCTRVARRSTRRRAVQSWSPAAPRS